MHWFCNCNLLQFLKPMDAILSTNHRNLFYSMQICLSMVLKIWQPKFYSSPCQQLWCDPPLIIFWHCCKLLDCIQFSDLAGLGSQLCEIFSWFSLFFSILYYLWFLRWSGQYFLAEKRRFMLVNNLSDDMMNKFYFLQNCHST